MAQRTRGLFGGTFDPPHLGHVAAARAAVASLGLDELVVTVARDPQLKPDTPTAPAAARYEMALAAFEGLDKVRLSDIELRRDGPTYTVDTVTELLDEDSGATLFLVVGADAASTLASWHRAGELAGLVTVAVVPRPGPSAAAPPGFRVVEVAMEPVDLSSTGIRAALGRGEDPAGLVPERVVPLVLANRLYSR